MSFRNGDFKREGIVVFHEQMKKGDFGVCSNHYR